MDNPVDQSQTRGRYDADLPTLSDNGNPYLPRRESSLSQGDGSDVFEDAREEWELPAEEPSPPLPSQPVAAPPLVQATTWRRTYQPPRPPKIDLVEAMMLQHNIKTNSTPVSGAEHENEPSTDTRYDKDCGICNSHVRHIWHCNVCKILYCDNCWMDQPLHRRPAITGHGDIPHEKTDPIVADKVKAIMFPPVDDWTRQQLYREDEMTSWFGVERPSDSGPPLFQDYGRFADLMSSTDVMINSHEPDFVDRPRSLGRDSRTPSLVSFVGETGAGKSTLIKLLIDFGLQGTGTCSSPVVGPRGAHLPTSEDVHLYMDPRSAYSKGPLLYADCEGLEGGEREPLGALFRKKRNRDIDPMEKALKNNKVISERELEWADGPRERTREFAVMNLYPRLLYAFSDVIVFVLKNPRVVEHVFERLITWAAAAIEKSSNQPVRPHAIIVLNASDNGIDEQLWDVPTNTESILKDLDRTVNRNDKFKGWAQFWRERKKPIDTMSDLVTCYYSSVQILRVPQESRPKLMRLQVEKLYHATVTACLAARSARNQLRMLMDVDDLQNYLQDAFSHFATTLDSPFDFVQASFRNSPIPPGFGGNILKLALNVMDILHARGDEVIEPRSIFSEIAWMVASCIMLESARHKTKGAATEIFANYTIHLDDALENFCNHHWPCMFFNYKKERCVNVRVGHQSKGHQSKDGKIFAVGDYVSGFSFDTYYTDFRSSVFKSLVCLLKELALRVQRGESEDIAAAFVHKDIVLTKLFRCTTSSHSEAGFDGLLHSQTACFCCLFGQAEVPLPCGHVICMACLKIYGKARGSGDVEYELGGCPIEGYTSSRSLPISSWRIQLKPRSTGARVMTLDGGGIRGIVELEVLKHIERALGGLPIRCLFDLIVGTSTGGLVALGLSTMNWTVDECIQKFQTLCDQAFTRRLGSNVPIIGALVENHHHSRYQTTTIEDALKTAFPQELRLFGGQRPADMCVSPLKVAVTATSLAGNKAYLLSNYNRPESGVESSSYQYQRPERIDTELKIWEAARATSAAPRFFKSFHHEPSKKTYIDGAIHHNNPCRIADAERKRLWPDSDIPDIFLSIGTGASITLERHQSERMKAARNGVFSHGKTLFNILRKNMETALDCDRIWDDYFASVATGFRQADVSSRFHRLNPRLEGEVPALDQKDKMDDVRRLANAALRGDTAINRVAHQLLASLFYFQLITISDGDKGGHYVQGKIMCRISQLSAELHTLGRHLAHTMREHGTLSFIAWDESGATCRPQGMYQQVITLRIIEELIREQRFDMPRFKFVVQNKLVPIHINLCFGDLTTVPISGNPRPLFTAMANDDSNRNHSQTNLSRFPTGLDNSTRSPRYTHGSRRVKKVATWEPPEVLECASLTDLQSYADPDRVFGSDVTKDREIDEEPPNDILLPLKSSLPPQPAPEQQVLKGSTLVKAFRALLWPIRARPHTSDSATIHEWIQGLEVDNMSMFVDYGDPEQEPAAPSTMQYYHVDSAENEIYQQWAGLLGPSIGQWVPLNSVKSAPYREVKIPAQPELPDSGGPSELPADSQLAAELSDVPYNRGDIL